MTYEQAKEGIRELRERFDNPYGEADKQRIAELYRQVLGKTFHPTTCQQCYHDAVIEIYIYIKNNNAMAQKSNYRLKAGFIIACPDFHGGKIYTNDNLTDKVAKEYLGRYPNMEDYFQRIPAMDEDEGQE